ncbi:GntR family transcriptional regulator [Polymorphospora sp. NPDC051019]|uniref:GntR family transcriptional regulator n=1 Tax=unclassified Polymorphospora TaxID=2685497 RepID=UPI0033D82620
MADSSKLTLPTFARRMSLREKVADALRGAIVSGEMKPGELYSAPDLAERFGVSATPVREAMLDLVKQGLVNPVRNKGFQVTAVSEADLDHITRIRELLEPPAAGEACGHITPELLTTLQSLAGDIVAAAAEGDLIRYIGADHEFHRRLLGAGGNHRLVRIVEDLRSQSRLYGLASLAEAGQLVRNALEHVQMCDLIQAGKASDLEDLMRTHIGRVRREWAGRPS